MRAISNVHAGRRFPTPDLTDEPKGYDICSGGISEALHARV